jgi:hypothetical protein
MLLPGKHENLTNNILVVGADILKILKDGSYNLEEIFQNIKRHYNEVSLDRILDCIAYLWLCDFIIFEDNLITLNKINSI